MKRFECFLFLLAIACFVSVAGYVGYAMAGSLSNQQCVSMYPTGNCNKVGAAQCAGGGSSCSYCNISSALPNRSCVAMEGATCAQGGGAAQFCSGGNMVTGDCDGQSCVQTGSGESCGGESEPFFPCI